MVRLAFHKGRKFPKRGWLLSGIIKMFIGRFSHVELNFPMSDTEMGFPGLSFSSRGSERKRELRGVHWKRIKYSHPDRWVFAYIPMTTSKIGYLRLICNKFIGKKYDVLGAVVWCGLRLRAERKSKWWCSEICGRVLCRVVDLVVWKLDPLQLYNSVLQLDGCYIGDENGKRL